MRQQIEKAITKLVESEPPINIGRPPAAPGEWAKLGYDWFISGDPSGSFHGVYLAVSPAKLVARFGTPSESDGYKVSGQYVFRKDNVTVCVYDWKETTLYDRRGIDPSELWRSQSPLHFHVGGPGEEEERDLVGWIRSQLGEA